MISPEFLDYAQYISEWLQGIDCNQLED